MSNNSPTVAGHCKKSPDTRKLELVDAINQVFTLFRLNYHNQYLKAFGNTLELNEVKRLWLEMLHRFDAPTILSAAKMVIETSEFLPTLHTMIHYCERASTRFNLPDAHSAYREACRAPSPKASYHWSHPAIYYAGKACDWHFLQSNSEHVAFPIFREKWEGICADIRNGKEFESPQAPSLEEIPAPPLDKHTNQERLMTLKDSLNL